MTQARATASQPARPRRVLLALGSNLGDRVAQLRTAVAGMRDVAATSSVWETAPIGGPEGQGPYLNMVVLLRTSEPAREMLELVRRLERDAGRKREVHWGPRTLDVDVLWIDGETSDDPELLLPHPRLFERPFVLAPLEEVAPDLVPANWRAELGTDGLARMGPLKQL